MENELKRANGRRNRYKAAFETLVIVAFDLLLFLLLFKLSIIIRKNVMPFLYEGFAEFGGIPSESPYRWWIFALWSTIFFYEGLYSKRFSFWDEVGVLWKATFFSTVGVFSIVSIGKLSTQVSRTTIILMGLLSLVMHPLCRMFFKKLLRRAGLLKRRVLILGAGKTGAIIARAFKNEPNFGYEVVGYLDDAPEKIGTTLEGVKIHRGVDSAQKYLQRCNITDLIIAMPGAGKDRVNSLINELQYKAQRLLLIPDIFGLSVVGTSLHHFFYEQAFALEIKNNLASPFNVFVKRCFDFAVGALLMAVFALPIALFSLLIRLGSKGPAIFSQQRVGKKGRLFQCYKFRTMYKGAGESLEELLQSNDAAKAQWEEHRKLRDDPRVTPVGRFLRSTSLDELPQLFNVLKGDMSLIGPRPVTTEEIQIYYRENADLCFSVPPGITGLWQVSGRSNTSYDYRVALDSWYVKNWNLWLDVVILLKTVRVVLAREGAF